jgi:hypothetical protein
MNQKISKTNSVTETNKHIKYNHKSLTDKLMIKPLKFKKTPNESEKEII